MKKIVKKMTVFILTMVVAGMLWSTGMPQTQAAENTSVFKISMDKTKIKAGDSFRVTLELKEGADLSSFMLTLPYDNSLLKCKKNQEWGSGRERIIGICGCGRNDSRWIYGNEGT